jgi:hypothetical protein
MACVFLNDDLIIRIVPDGYDDALGYPMPGSLIQLGRSYWAGSWFPALAMGLIKNCHPGKKGDFLCPVVTQKNILNNPFAAGWYFSKL